MTREKAPRNPGGDNNQEEHNPLMDRRQGLALYVC